MSQIKIYGVREKLFPIRDKLSDIIHACVVDALQFPVNKRAHRFFYLDSDDFFKPEGRSLHYLIIELIMIEGRTVETKKSLIRLLFEQISTQLHIDTTDIEICIIESPAYNWGFRGQTGDEVIIDYKINV